MSRNGLISSLGLGYTAMAPWGGVAILGALLAREIWSWYRLRHIPGPFINAISIYWMFRKAIGLRIHYDLFELSEKYGRLLFLPSVCCFLLCGADIPSLTIKT